jgi:hypothetical protein
MTEKVEHISVEIADNRWKKAADAHLTTFYHAQENNITSFWNIDADDTSFCLPPAKVASALLQVEKCAVENNIEIFSLDMLRSMNQGAAWSFGVTYNYTEKHNWMQIIELYCRDKEYKTFQKLLVQIDYYIYYLSETYHFPVGSFYIKNTNFVHWKMQRGPLLYRFRDGAVYFPTKLTDLLSVSVKAGKIKIFDDVIAIDAGISVTDNKEYSKKSYLRHISKSYDAYFRNLWKENGPKGMAKMVGNKMKATYEVLTAKLKGESHA